MPTLEDVIAGLPAEEQKAIAEETERLKAEYLTLQALRKARDMTQVELAQKLGKSQSAIAKMEKGTDVMLSTVRSYIEGMGGTLELVARFPGRPPVILDRLREDDDDRQAASSATAKSASQQL